MRYWTKVIATLLAVAAGGRTPAAAQIRVNPTGVNVNTQGATTVFLTFGPVRGYTPAEAFWCGALVPATPARGQRCDPATIFGRLPLRNDLSRMSGSTQFTDIMSIPASVSRRAYQDAAAGRPSAFYYVRRFVSTSGGPDEYVAVTCRLTGGGARSPLALTDVAVEFTPPVPVLFTAAGASLPPLSATLTYTGTGQLRGRWEVVRPGEELPTPQDLLTEGTLPPEDRGLQRRYTELERFNVFLPPGGRFTLPGPDPARLPNDVDGMYLVLLRIEVSDDKEGDSNLGAVGGRGVVHTGAVAGFPMPTLRYVVGESENRLTAGERRSALRLLLPAEGARIAADSAAVLSWVEDRAAAVYRVEFESGAGASVFTALVAPGVGAYRPPPFVRERAQGAPLRWRVVGLDGAGNPVSRSPWRTLRLLTS